MPIILQYWWALVIHFNWRMLPYDIHTYAPLMGRTDDSAVRAST